MVLKLDMSKAYDRVEWSFLRVTMEWMGFGRTWVEFIIQCVTSVSYSMIVNGKAREVCKPSIGLWQGDPLSPFVFLICSEGLSALMKLALNEGLVKGDKVSRRGLQIMHILFADDCVLFGEANEKGAHTLKRFLKEYEVCLG